MRCGAFMSGKTKAIDVTQYDSGRRRQLTLLEQPMLGLLRVKSSMLWLNP